MRQDLEAVIFDLGGVFLDIDYARTRQAFIELGVTDFDAYYQQSHSNPLFARLEKGDIEPEDFYETFRSETGLQADNERLAAAWNALLLDFRPGSVDFLRQLKGRYRLFLFSNTNAIHHAAFLDIHERQFGHRDFDGLFEKAWYSHELGWRKPDPEAYREVMRRHGLQAERTLFVDDTPVNIEGAREAGLHTWWLQPGQLLEENPLDL